MRIKGRDHRRGCVRSTGVPPQRPCPAARESGGARTPKLEKLAAARAYRPGESPTSWGFTVDELNDSLLGDLRTPRSSPWTSCGASRTRAATRVSLMDTIEGPGARPDPGRGRSNVGDLKGPHRRVDLEAYRAREARDRPLLTYENLNPAGDRRRGARRDRVAPLSQMHTKAVLRLRLADAGGVPSTTDFLRETRSLIPRIDAVGRRSPQLVSQLLPGLGVPTALFANFSGAADTALRVARSRGGRPPERGQGRRGPFLWRSRYTTSLVTFAAAKVEQVRRRSLISRSDVQSAFSCRAHWKWASTSTRSPSELTILLRIGSGTPARAPRKAAPALRYSRSTPSSGRVEGPSAIHELDLRVHPLGPAVVATFPGRVDRAHEVQVRRGHWRSLAQAAPQPLLALGVGRPPSARGNGPPEWAWREGRERRYGGAKTEAKKGGTHASCR